MAKSRMPWKKDYDNTGWTAVELPHDWSVAMPFPDPIPAAPDMQPAASDGIVEPFPCLRSIVENASCCCLTVSTKKARSGSTVIITAFIPMDTHLFLWHNIPGCFWYRWYQWNQRPCRPDRDFRFPMVYRFRNHKKGNAPCYRSSSRYTIWHLLFHKQGR